MLSVIMVNVVMVSVVALLKHLCSLNDWYFHFLHLRMQGFESSFNKDFLKTNSTLITKDYIGVLAWN